MSPSWPVFVTFLTIILAVLRIGGHRDLVFKTTAHLGVMMIFALWVSASEYRRFYRAAFWAICAVEIACFFLLPR